MILCHSFKQNDAFLKKIEIDILKNALKCIFIQFQQFCNLTPEFFPHSLFRNHVFLINIGNNHLICAKEMHILPFLTIL